MWSTPVAKVQMAGQIPQSISTTAESPLNGAAVKSCLAHLCFGVLRVKLGKGQKGHSGSGSGWYL